MNSLWKSLGCGVIAAALILPLPALANSLHLAPKPQQQARNTSDHRPAEGQTAPAQGEAAKSPRATAPVLAAGEKASKSDASRLDESVPSAERQAPKSGTPASQDEALDAITGLKTGEQRRDVPGKLLVIPEQAKAPSFLAGNWAFDHFFVLPDGTPLRAEFSFDGNGRGVASFVDGNNVRHQAEAAAAVSDGVLKLQTSPYTSSQSADRYYPEFMECRNVGGAALCRGTDGFSSWEGQRVAGTAAGGSDAAHGTSASGGASAGTTGLAQDSDRLTELSSEGAELPPAVMEQSEKAKSAAGGNALSALAGDWRYSRDLARKADGESVALEFHFDDAGQGYSVIREGSGKEFKAAADATALKDGTIRVRTDAYGNGGDRGYFPTFMECRSGKSAELLCDVSNGWTRVEDGMLVSKKALEEQNRRLNMEELLPVVPEQQKVPPSGAAAEGGVDIADILAGLSEASSASTKAARLSLPQKEGSLSFLEGHWRCNTGLARTKDNLPIVVEFRFDRDGKGTASIRESTGGRFDASARAVYSKGMLRINTSEFRSKNSRSGYSRSFIECSDHGGEALCNGRNGGVSWSGASFVRLK